MSAQKTPAPRKPALARRKKDATALESEADFYKRAETVMAKLKTEPHHFAPPPPSEPERLDLEALKSGKQKILHYYSEAVNEHMKVFRFYVHLSRVGEAQPFLWLSRKQYKTLRNGHEFFHRETVTNKRGIIKATWRNYTFRLEPAAGEITITQKTSNGFFVEPDAKSKKTEFMLYLLKSVRNHH